MNTELTPRQQKLYDALKGQGDVPILDLFEAMGGSEVGRDDPRYAQQWLGPIISGLNRRLDGEKVVPGQLKQTYTLIIK